MNNTFILNTRESNQVHNFHAYCHYGASAFCAVCLRILYPDEVSFRDFSNNEWPCMLWNKEPFRSWPKEWVEVNEEFNGRITAVEANGVIVCKVCAVQKPPFEKLLIYPGKKN